MMTKKTKTKMRPTQLDAPGYRVDEAGKVTALTQAEVNRLIVNTFSEALKQLRIRTLH
jgi:hypothetical protein